LVETERAGPSGCRQRLGQLDKQIARLNRRDVKLGRLSDKYWRARRIILGIGIILTIALYELAGDRRGLPSLGVSTAVFAAVAFYHRRVLTSIRKNGEWINSKRSQIARIRLDWDKIPRPAHGGNAPGHPFELDLDITGDASLHRLLDVCMTTE